MKMLAFLLICFFSSPCFSFGKQLKNRHLFVEWRHWDSTIVLGALEGRKFKRKPLLIRSLRLLTPEDVSKWLGESGNGEAILYFHAMWGQQVNFQRKCLRSVDDILRDQPDDGIQTVISFIWHAGGVAYPLNWQGASEKGEPLGRLIRLIATYFDDKVNVLCHSMGNRFFEGTLRTMTDSHEKDTIFGTVILFSPDLDAEVGDPDFIRLCQSAEEVVVFIHRRDRLLMLSSWTLGRERLGRNGPKGDITAFSTSSRLLVIDMTDHVSGFQNHTHLDKAWVQERMRMVLKP